MSAEPDIGAPALPCAAGGTPASDELIAVFERDNDTAEALLRSSPKEALTLCRDVIARAQAAGIAHTVPFSRFLAGTALSLLTDFAGARQCLELAAEEAQALGLERLANRCMNGLAVIFEFTGEFGRGLQMLEKCLATARHSADAAAEIRALCNLGNIYVAMKEHERAHALFRDALASAERESNTLLWVICAGSFAESLTASKRIDESESLLARFIPMAESEGHHLQLGFLLKIRATNLLAKGMPEAADEILQRAEAIARDVKDINLLCDVLLCVAESAVSMKTYDRAQIILDEVGPLSRSVELRLYEVRAYALEAKVAAERQQFERAYLALCREIEVERTLAAETTSRKTQILTVEFEVESHRQAAAAERERSALLDLSNQRLNDANRKLQRALDQLEHTASHDATTGLLNRWKFQDLAEAALRSATEGQEHCALCFIDLNDFKRVNDTFGHDAGDTLLAEVARRLKQTLRGCDIVARLGGDEFVVLLRELAGPQQLDGILEKLRAVWQTPFDLGRAHSAAASIGVAFWPRDGLTLAELQKCADARMYEEKLGRAPRKRRSRPR